MDCCRGAVCAQVFTEDVARRDMRRYRKRGLRRIERQMLASLAAGQVGGARVLEIGGGIGVLQAELLGAGAASGEVVELVGAYERFARELAESKGVAGRTAFRVADILAEPETVAPADIVLLNGVICCTPDAHALTQAAARLTRGALVLSYVRRAPWTSPVAAALNASMALRRRSYRAFLRPTSEVVAPAESAGLRLTARGGTPIYEFVTFAA
jgi:2-polyprenyl-3-methyl-5-hydroxy-6-metoxy-1,4-benzoquinol methylase